MRIHPRWCGEHCKGTGLFISVSGSSPLARGTHAYLSVVEFQDRFIPAGAGNTRVYGSGYSQDAVHPRWCGERSVRPAHMTLFSGSSPLVRGTLKSFDEHLNSLRFIPAGAGNTPFTRVEIIKVLVHPRWCGEHDGISVCAWFSFGSSPLVRGTRKRDSDRRWPCRFIPAGAGNTPSHLPCQRNSAVHPRWCGEHPHVPCLRRRSPGSSPLVRGTHVSKNGVCDNLRFIPAGAGNT